MVRLMSCLPLSHVAHYDEVRNVPKAVVEVFKEAAGGKDYFTGAELKRALENFQGDAFTVAEAEAFVENSKAKAHSHHHILHDSSHGGSKKAGGMTLQGFVKLLLNPVFNGPLKPQEVVSYNFCHAFQF